MTNYAKKRTLTFLALAFGITWLAVIPAGIMLGAFEVGEQGAPAIVTIIGMTMFAPLVAALIANHIMPPEGRIDLCLRPCIKGNVRAYLVAWFAPAVLTALGTALFFVLNPSQFDPTMSYITSTIAQLGVEGAPTPTAEELSAMIPATVVAATLFAPFINAIPALGEEVGWRGMLFPSLCEMCSPRKAAVVSGIIWGLWHAPVIAMGHNYGMDTPGFPISNILVMTLACTAVGILLAALRQRSGSVWPCALAHGAVNAAANIGVLFTVAGPGLFGPSPLALVSGIPIFVAAVAVLFSSRMLEAAD